MPGPFWYFTLEFCNFQHWLYICLNVKVVLWFLIFRTLIWTHAPKILYSIDAIQDVYKAFSPWWWIMHNFFAKNVVFVMESGSPFPFQQRWWNEVLAISFGKCFKRQIGGKPEYWNVQSKSVQSSNLTRVNFDVKND